jgi:hypothetical protein
LIHAIVGVFDANNLPSYISICNRLTGDDNPAILMDSSPAQDLDEDEQDLDRIHTVYRYWHAVWHFSCDYIINESLNKYGSEVHFIVEEVHYSALMQGHFSRILGPAYGHFLFGSITRFGLICASVEKIEGNQVKMTIGKRSKIQDCTSKKLFSVSDVLKDCTHQQVVYYFSS